MADLQSLLALSSSGMTAQSTRLRHISENIANADTPGYHRKTVTFAEAHAQNGSIEAGPVQLDRAPLERIYDPGHALAGADGYYDGSNVELVIELADAREAQRSYDANLKMFDQVRQMSSSLLDLLRR